MAALKKQEKAAKTERDQRLARIRQVCERARIRLKESCAARREATRAEARGKISTAKQSRKQLRQDYGEIKRLEGHAAERRKAHQRLPAEAIRESDDAVRHNIPPELVPVFDKVRRSIKGTPLRSRTEAFLEYVDENPDDVAAIMEAALPSDDQFSAAYAEWAAAGAA